MTAIPHDAPATGRALPIADPAPAAAAGGCHGGAERMRAAAAASGKGELLAELARDYPVGPHDQPQSMCPAFGSLRVGLRMRRTATILSGSACCVYGLTFTSHFYGARRTVGYVPFNSETLVTGTLFEDIRQAVTDMADPARYDTIIVTNLCVPTASGVPLQRLPREINGVRVVGIDVPGFGVPTHAEAKDVLAGALLRYARGEAEAGPVRAPRATTATGERRPSVTLVGELFPVDPVTAAHLVAPLGLTAGPQVPPREWRELYAGLDGAVAAAVHPFYTAAIRELQLAGRPVVGSAPVGAEGTAAWLEAIAEATGASAEARGRALDAALPAIRAALAAHPLDLRVTVSGYEGSELIVARAMAEAGADVRYVGTACPRTPWSADDCAWLEARGARVQYRASLEQDVAAAAEFEPDLAIGTTPLVQWAKERAMPALYFTNVVSARPLFGAAGPGSLAALVQAAVGNRERHARMRRFFEGVGTGVTAGYGFTAVPTDRPEVRERIRRHRAAEAKKRASIDMGG